MLSAMESRRDRFRRQLARLAGTGNPREAIDAGLYVPRPASSERLLKKIELQPQAIRVLTGPIGSGKSTELLVIAEELNQRTDLWAHVVDVSLLHDLGDLREGALLASGLLGVADRLQIREESIDNLRNAAYGSGPYKGIGSGSRQSGVLTSPTIRGTLLPIVVDKIIRDIRATLALKGGRTPIILFDSIDRVRDHYGFRTMLERDARRLVDDGFGLVLTAPVDVLWSDSGELRAMTETWDTLSYEDPATTHEARTFLLEVLRRRADVDLLSEPTWMPLVQASGGVLRDLIELARKTVEEAYLAGQDTVGPAEVSSAIAHFARALSLGLDGTAISTLLSVQATQQVRAFDEPTLRLLKNRQILEHRDASGSYFEPHPTLESLLQRWAEAS